MKDEECIELKSMRAIGSDGRDEMNLAEFPLCCLAHRLPEGQKTFRFEDRVWDEGRGAFVARKLTVTGSDAYGLPTALDDEVLLGLIQLSRQTGFAARKVSFTRYQLIRLLGWRDESKTYDRLEESLNRWTGVTLYYEKAWWDKRLRCWVDEKFHVIDNVWLCHRSDPRHDRDAGPPTSAFVWNEVLYGSFQAGNLKAIDFEFFKTLRSAIAKRLYRFLDKRFHQRHRWEFDLKELSWNHVGLSRNYDAASLKRKLRTGIQELEKTGYLLAMREGDRFRKVSSAQWRVVFARSPKSMRKCVADTHAKETHPLAAALIQRGVSAKSADSLIRKHAPEKIQDQLAVVDWLVAMKDSKVSRNAPGFLVSAIECNYAPPPGFISPAKRELIEQEKRLRKVRVDERTRQREEARQKQESERQKSIEQFLQSLSDAGRDALEKSAISRATQVQRRLIEEGGGFAEAARLAAINAEALRCIQEHRAKASLPSAKLNRQHPSRTSS